MNNNVSPTTLWEFATLMMPSIKASPFHLRYYRLLQAFAEGRISRLIISVPPQHGKSLGSTVMLPALMLGNDPDLRVAVASYSASLAQRFGRRVQRLIDSEPYSSLFPDTTIKGAGSRQSSYVRTAETAEIIGHEGSLTAVGREGSLTGNQVDVFIIDDLYKDAMEANSPVIRDNCWDWYTSVVRTREHNLSRELIVMTRWHEDDLIGRLLSNEPFEPLCNWKQIDQCRQDCWLVWNVEALKESEPTELDNRAKGEPLWGERHSKELLDGKRRLDALRFECMYQGHPDSGEGLLYGRQWRTYHTLPHNIVRRANYTDTADTGDDYLCSVNYSVDYDQNIYVEDVVYTRKPMEQSEQMTADMLNGGGVREVLVESNNGGRGFARSIGRLAAQVKVEWFHQSANKEARILSNASSVVRFVVMPDDWVVRWGEFASHLTSYNRLFRSNRWHDAADVLTGIVERETGSTLRRKIKALSFS